MRGMRTAESPARKLKNSTDNGQACLPTAVCCEQIRERAYHKWEAAGCPCCDGVEFWLQAEAELAAEADAQCEKRKT
jgi:hypothetical protein